MTAHRIHISRSKALRLVLAAALAGIGLPGLAGEVRVGVRAIATDPPDRGEPNIDAGFSPPLIVSATAMDVAGPARADGQADGDGLNGALRANLKALVSADRVVVGRGANATSDAFMTGVITLSGSAPPGVATFSAVLEGAYIFGPSPFAFMNSASLEYSARVGDVDFSVRSGRLDFDPRTGGGLFSVPLSWTLAVSPGLSISMDFSMRGSVTSVIDAVELDVSNTFKLTAIDLPAGYTYSSDAEGFLSQFQPSAVSEPASASLMALALSVGFMLSRRGAKKRRGSVGHPA